MNRLYAVEPAPTITGTMADHRLAIPSHQVATVAQAIAEKLEGKVAAPGAALAEAQRRWVDAVARDLQAHKGASSDRGGRDAAAAGPRTGARD